MGRKVNFIVLAVLVAISFIYGIVATPGSDWPEVIETHPGDVAWMVVASAFVLLMTPGLAFFYGGMVDRKNVISTMLQSFVALGVISILWVVVGFSLCFGESIGGIIGNPMTFMNFRGVGAAPHPQIGSSIPFLLFALFQLKFAIITPRFDHGQHGGTDPVPELHLIYGAVFTVHLCSARPHDMAPRWAPHEPGCFGLCRRNSGAHVCRIRGFGRRCFS